MSVVEGHATADGYEITARLIAPNGAKVVYTAKGPTLEEAQAKMLAMIDDLIFSPPEEKGESS